MPCKQRGIPAAQDFDAGVGVEQEPHAELPARGFWLGLVRDAVGKVRHRPEITQHFGIGAADVAGVGPLHAQEKQKIWL